MSKTHIAIYEWGATTASYKIDPLVSTGSVWDDCLLAIEMAGHRSAQYPGQAIRRPNAWSNPAYNEGSNAASKAYGPGVLANPHVHGGQGPNHRAAIGCKVTPANAQAGHTYQFMKIYLGQFS